MAKENKYFLESIPNCNALLQACANEFKTSKELREELGVTTQRNNYYIEMFLADGYLISVAVNRDKCKIAYKSTITEIPAHKIIDKELRKKLFAEKRKRKFGGDVEGGFKWLGNPYRETLRV